MATLRELTLGTPPAEASLFSILVQKIILARKKCPESSLVIEFWETGTGPQTVLLPIATIQVDPQAQTIFCSDEETPKGSEYTLTNFMCVHVSHIKTIQIQTDG